MFSLGGGTCGLTLDPGHELLACVLIRDRLGLMVAEALPSHPIPHPDAAGTVGAAQPRASSATSGPIAGRPRQAVPGVPGGAQPNPTKRSPGKHSSRDHDGIMVGTVPLPACLPQSRLVLPVPLTLPCWSPPQPAPPPRPGRGVPTALWHLLLPGPLDVGGARGSSLSSCPLLPHSGWSQGGGRAQGALGGSL